MTAPVTRRRDRSLSRIFAIPAAIGVASLIGLVAGLTGDGARDLIAWLCLSLPLVALAVAWRRRG